MPSPGSDTGLSSSRADRTSRPGAPTVAVRYEQAVYGSFPFWDKGYAVLAQSPGCRPEWLAELRAACQRHGERPLGVSEAGGLFALRLPSGPWAIVGVGSPGADDQGRPGALAFHALFVGDREFRKVQHDPFALAGALRRDWGPATRTLPAGTRAIGLPALLDDRHRPEASWIADKLAQGRRVALETAEPIDDLARQVWSRLPERVRRRASVATFTFSNANRFDLVALPRLAGIPLDATYLSPPDPASWPHPSPGASEDLALDPDDSRRGRLLMVAALIAVVLIGLAMVVVRDVRNRSLAPSTASAPTVDTSYPDRSDYLGEPPDAEERVRVTEALLDMAERFGVIEVGRSAADTDATALMVALAERLRYRGPYLDAKERIRLANEPGAGRDRALAWDAQVRRFADDRPLPPDFTQGPLRWQLDTLGWSFHIAPDPRRSAAEVPHALAAALAVEGPVRPDPLSARYPALAAYTRFLGRLPRR